MRIAVDVMGGDHGCQVVIAGARMALDAGLDVKEILLVGNQNEIAKILSANGPVDSRLKIIHAEHVLTMDESPVSALRQKKDTSIARAVELVKQGQADALVSPGNTGSVVASSAISLRTIPGVERPAIATTMPSASGKYILLDAGANVDCRPEHLLHFAVMGSLYASIILGKPEPRVGLINVGTEDCKGNKLVQATFKLLRQSGLNFVGNVESHDLFAGRVEVAVCDGFVGNVFLKTVESTAHMILSAFQGETPSNALIKLKGRMDPDNFGGAPLLGVNGIVIIAHGSSREKAILNAIRGAAETVRHDLRHKIESAVEQVNRSVMATPQA
jgi:glycerol-3-phosphate acyltransferase PlsX